jgi:protein TonB
VTISATFHDDAPCIGIRHFHTPQCVLAGCLLASVAVHALVFAFWLPGWTQPQTQPPAPVLEVVMVSGEPEAVSKVTSAGAHAAPQTVEPRSRHAERTASTAHNSRPAERLTGASTKSAAQSANDAAMTVPVQAASGPANVATASAPARVEAATPPAFNAAYLRNPPPRYPPAARRNGDEGRVMLRVLVNPDGAPARVEIDQSSGSPLLDGAALDAVRGWRFVPARRGAQNVEGWVRVPLVFRLES